MKTYSVDERENLDDVDEGELAQDAFLRLSRRMDVGDGSVGPIPSDWPAAPRAVTVGQVMEHAYLIQFFAMSGQLHGLMQLLTFFADQCDDKLVQCLPATMVQLLGIIADGNLPVLQHPASAIRDLVDPVRAAAGALRARCRVPSSASSATEDHQELPVPATLQPQEVLDVILRSEGALADGVYLAELLMRLHEVFQQQDQRAQLTDAPKLLSALTGVLEATKPANHLALLEALMVVNDLLTPYTTTETPAQAKQQLPFWEQFARHHLDANLSALVEAIAATTQRVVQAPPSPSDIDMTVELVPFALRAIDSCLIILPMNQVAAGGAKLKTLVDLLARDEQGRWTPSGGGRSLQPLVEMPVECASCRLAMRFGRPACSCCQFCEQPRDKCECDETADPRFTLRLLGLLRLRLKAIESGVCAACGKHTSSLKNCARCRLVKYCDASCQKEHWRIHKSSCAATSAS